jgi:hypothetical protein
MSPLGSKFAPMGQSSLLGVKVCPMGQSSPLGVKVCTCRSKFTPGGQSLHLWVKVCPYGSKFIPGGQSSSLGIKVHSWGSKFSPGDQNRRQIGSVFHTGQSRRVFRVCHFVASVEIEPSKETAIFSCRLLTYKEDSRSNLPIQTCYLNWLELSSKNAVPRESFELIFSPPSLWSTGSIFW